MDRKLLLLIPCVAILVGLGLVIRSRLGLPVGPPSSEGSVGRGPERTPKVQPPPSPPALPPAPPARGAGTLKLTVTANGQPAQGAQVLMKEEFLPNIMPFHTEEDGTQTLRAIPAGFYGVDVSYRSFISQKLRVEIKPDQVSALLVDLKAGGQIRGSVHDPAGHPVAQSTVRLMDGQTGYPMNPDRSTQTDDQGMFLLEGVPVAEVGLFVFHPRYQPWRKSGLKLRDVSDVLQVDAVLDPGVQVTGVVQDQEGRPIRGAHIVATNENSFMGVSDAAGRFIVYGMARSPMTVSVRARGYGTRYLYDVPPGSGDLSFQLVKGGAILVHLDGEAAPAGFSLFLWRYDPRVGGETRILVQAKALEKGDYRAEDVDPGEYRLMVDVPNFVPEETPTVTVLGSQVTPPVRVRLRKR